MKIVVYFKSGCNARFDSGKVVFLNAGEIHRMGIKNLLEANPGKAIVNTDSICFVREVPEEISHDE